MIDESWLQRQKCLPHLSMYVAEKKFGRALLSSTKTVVLSQLLLTDGYIFLLPYAYRALICVNPGDIPHFPSFLFEPLNDTEGFYISLLSSNKTRYHSR
jgi:hypothetical protein